MSSGKKQTKNAQSKHFRRSNELLTVFAASSHQAVFPEGSSRCQLAQTRNCTEMKMASLKKGLLVHGSAEAEEVKQNVTIANHSPAHSQRLQQVQR